MPRAPGGPVWVLFGRATCSRASVGSHTGGAGSPIGGRVGARERARRGPRGRVRSTDAGVQPRLLRPRFAGVSATIGAAAGFAPPFFWRAAMASASKLAFSFRARFLMFCSFLGLDSNPTARRVAWGFAPWATCVAAAQRDESDVPRVRTRAARAAPLGGRVGALARARRRPRGRVRFGRA